MRNQADSLAYTAEKTVREAGEKIPADIRTDIEARVKDVRDAPRGERAGGDDPGRGRSAAGSAAEGGLGGLRPGGRGRRRRGWPAPRGRRRSAAGGRGGGGRVPGGVGPAVRVGSQRSEGRSDAPAQFFPPISSPQL